jgi:hypothetical protein
VLPAASVAVAETAAPSASAPTEATNGAQPAASVEQSWSAVLQSLASPSVSTV